MKSIYLASAVLIVLAAGAVGCSFYVNDIATELGEYASAIEEEIKAEDYEAARDTANELDDRIEKNKTLLCAVVDHKDIYEIKTDLRELEQYLENSEKSDSLASCAAIAAVTDRISDNSLPYVYNIL